MLDEPTNHLDITYQIDILRLVRNLGISCSAVLYEARILLIMSTACTLKIKICA